MWRTRTVGHNAKITKYLFFFIIIFVSKYMYLIVTVTVDSNFYNSVGAVFNEG